MEFTITIAPVRPASGRWAWSVERKGEDGPSTSGRAESEEAARRRAEECAEEMAQQINQRRTYTYTAGEGTRS
ncbi:hypothetical protein DMA15_03720 [Streptomyces sp. WAC 01529]|uniref:hypothetical protein n=1 Tax=Streptomyces sp. WAC 01529 TaxID=2203205 RepID=UPI000F6D31D8|nr:hypothetical protein [Streptomyces sp. WAC 01529]AZM51802.1 hypothetical protein DMA15_03720 [Streptomyces sp. WAC 01529]